MQDEPVRQSRPATLALREILQISREFEGRFGRELGVNPTDLLAMEHLILHGPSGPSELARQLGITPPAATAVVDRLEAAGHVTRAINPADRRGIVVTPAQASVHRAMSILLPMITGVDAALDEFTPQEQAIVSAYLDRVVAIYREHAQA